MLHVFTQSHLRPSFFSGEGSRNSPKIGGKKIETQGGVKKRGLGVCYKQNRSKMFVFVNVMIFAFTTLVKNHQVQWNYDVLLPCAA